MPQVWVMLRVANVASQGMLQPSLLVPVPQSSSLHKPHNSAILRAGQHHRVPCKRCVQSTSLKLSWFFSTCDHKDQHCSSLLKKVEIVTWTQNPSNMQVKNPTSQSSAPKNSLLTQAHTPAPTCSALIWTQEHARLLKSPKNAQQQKCRVIEVISLTLLWVLTPFALLSHNLLLLGRAEIEQTFHCNHTDLNLFASNLSYISNYYSSSL